MKQSRGFADLVRIEPLEVRLCLTAGGLDPAFGQGGIAMTDIRGAASEGANALAIQGDGKVVIAGSADGHEGNLLLSRFLPSGTLDPSFGQEGIVLLDTPLNYSSAYGHDLTIDTTGRILVLARIDYKLTLLRYKSDGSLDTSFGHAGQVLIDDYSSIDPIASVRLTSGGKILVADGHSNAFVYRFNSDGSADRSFGESGTLTVDFGGSDSFLGLELRPDGSFIVAGTVERFGANRYQDVALARFTAAGQPDLSFAQTGRVVGMIFPTDAIIEHFALSADGRPMFSAVSAQGFSVARFRTDGVFDRAFGVRGIASIAVTGTFHDGLAMGAAPGGGIVIVGKSFGSSNGDSEPNRLFIARLTSTGAADLSFADAGQRVIATSPRNSNDTLEAVTLGSD